MTSTSCPYKQNSKTDCFGRYVGGGIAATAICNFVDERIYQDCQHYYTNAALARIAPDSFCCDQMRYFFIECAEPDGFMAGAFDVRKTDNDGKMVWRNFNRTRFNYCPFCGQKLGEPFNLATIFNDIENK